MCKNMSIIVQFCSKELLFGTRWKLDWRFDRAATESESALYKTVWRQPIRNITYNVNREDGGAKFRALWNTVIDNLWLRRQLFMLRFPIRIPNYLGTDFWNKKEQKMEDFTYTAWRPVKTIEIIPWQVTTFPASMPIVRPSSIQHSSPTFGRTVYVCM